MYFMYNQKLGLIEAGVHTKAKPPIPATMREPSVGAKLVDARRSV